MKTINLKGKGVKDASLRSLGNTKRYNRDGRKGALVAGYQYVGLDGERNYAHRVVMEQFLGRKLHKNEHVHHKNGNKLDNRIENLEVIDIKEHLSHHAKESGLGKDRIGVEPTNKVPIEVRRDIAKLRKEGWLYKELQEQYQLSYPTVRKYASEYENNFA